MHAVTGTLRGKDNEAYSHVFTSFTYSFLALFARKIFNQMYTTLGLKNVLDDQCLHLYYGSYAAKLYLTSNRKMWSIYN